MLRNRDKVIRIKCNRRNAVKNEINKQTSVHKIQSKCCVVLREGAGYVQLNQSIQETLTMLQINVTISPFFFEAWVSQPYQT